VLAFTAAAGASDGFVWWEFVLQDVGIGLATGLLVAFVAARVMPRDSGSETAISAHQKGLYGLAVAFVAYGAAVLPPEGNGLVSVFVAAIALDLAAGHRRLLRSSLRGPH
jgi:NhaP-type Na+/H+ or K+/H+ antiporter